MIRNYLQVTLRNLKKNFSYVFINTMGLGIALACCVTAYMFLAFNFEFNNFHHEDKVKNVYTILSHIRSPEGETYTSMGAPLVMIPAAEKVIPGIEGFTRYLEFGGTLRYSDKAFSQSASFADSTFFDMFDFPMKYGSAASFKEKHTVILDEKTAIKYFGNEDPVGKMMTANFINNTELDLIVGGVVSKVPPNSTFNFGMMLRIENYIDDIFKIPHDEWADWRQPSTFITVSQPDVARKMGPKFKPYGDRVSVLRPSIDIDSMSVHPFKEKYNQSEVQTNYVNGPIEPAPIIVFVSMAVVILLIACFNLTNTTIALTGKRLKEIGVRKAIGAQRKQIVFQFLLEIFLIMILSLFTGLLMVQIIAPAFVTMWDWPFTLSEMNGVNLAAMLILIVSFAALLAGIYPALFNSGFNPVSLLKGSVRINGTNFFTRTLVTLQFALCVIVLVGGFTFIQNAAFQEQVNFGYNKEDIINVSIQGNKDFELMEAVVRTNPQVAEVSGTDLSIGWGSYMAPATVDAVEYETMIVATGKNYFNTIGLTLLEGRFLNVENASDRENGMVVNRAFLEKTNIKDPIEKIVTVNKVNRHILGVVENHLDNLGRSEKPEPFAFIPAEPSNYHMMMVRTTPGNREEVRVFLEKTWKELIPTKPFESQFQDDILLGNARQINGNLRTIFLFLTVLGGLLSVSGIFSLASLNVTSRTKEIAIRKALGGSVQHIMLIMNREFLVIMLLAGALGAAGGWFFTRMLLDEIYKIHITLGWFPVVVCALIVFVTGMITTSATIRKAARTSPVKTLRSE